MKVLISGGTGFIGHHLIQTLINLSGFEVFVVIRNSTDLQKIERYNIPYFVFDPLHPEDLESFFNEHHFDGIIHLATHYLVNHSIKDIPNLISSNILFGTFLAHCAVVSGVKWFINTGTLFQYANSSTYNPFNLYAATKQAFEDILQNFKHDIILTTLYLNDSYGPEDTRNKIFNLWDKISKSGESIDMSSGEQYLNILYIDDIIQGFLCLIEHLNSNDAHIYNCQRYSLPPKEILSLRELSKIFENVTKKPLNINRGIRPYRENEIMIPYSGIQALPGWENKILLQNGIKKFLNF